LPVQYQTGQVCCMLSGVFALYCLKQVVMCAQPDSSLAHILAANTLHHRRHVSTPDSAKAGPSLPHAQLHNASSRGPITGNYRIPWTMIGQPPTALSGRLPGPPRLFCLYVSKPSANGDALPPRRIDWPGFEAASRLRQLIPLSRISSLNSTRII
jgi:hypothetical protein